MDGARLRAGTLLLVAAAGCSRPAPPGPADGGPGARAPAARLPYREGTLTDDEGERMHWGVLRLELGRTSLEALRVPGARLEQLGAERGLEGAFNGGFFEPSQAPSGLLISAGRTLGEPSVRGGSGVLWVSGGRAQVIGESDPLPAPREQAELAVQSGPRLVEGGKNGIRSDDGKRAARTAVCLREGGRVVEVVLIWGDRHPGEGLGLLQLGALLSAPSALSPSGCEAALNLDGGPSTGLFLPGDPARSHPSRGPVPWAIGARARAPD